MKQSSQLGLKKNMGKAALDSTDVRILAAVQQHGQLSKAALAEMVNLSPTPCWIRLRRLRQAGLIRGYHADIAIEQLVDLTKVIVTVSLKTHRKADFERFETWIKSTDEIVECIATGGGTDYVMKVISPNLTSFRTLIESLLTADIGIDRYMTYIVTREVKATLPNLQKLLAGKA